VERVAAHSTSRVFKPWTRWLVVAVTGLAVLLRLWGITFGLPYLYHPDEAVNMFASLGIFRHGDLNPHYFNYPSLFFYVHALSYVPFYGVGKLLGVFLSASDIPAPLLFGSGVGRTDLPSLFVLGRGLTAAFGSASVVLLYLAARRLTSDVVIALLAALMLALSPTNVEHSRFIIPETILVFFIVLSFWASVLVLQRGATLDYLLAGMACGLAASTKYNGGVILVLPIAAHFLRTGLSGWKERNIYLALLMSGVAFLAASPFTLLDYRKFVSDFRYVGGHYRGGHEGSEGNAALWYASYLVRVEGPLVILAVLESVRGIRNRTPSAPLVAVFPAAYFLLISGFAFRNARTALPLTPFLFVLASSFLANLFKPGNRENRQNSRMRIGVAGALTAVCLAVPLIQTVKQAVTLTTVDSRETARVWIDRNLPPGSRIALEAYSPFVDPQRFSVQGVSRIIDQTPEWYAAKGFDYVVLAENMFGRYYREPQKYARQVSAYEDFFRAVSMEKMFYDGGYEVRVYRIPKR